MIRHGWLGGVQARSPRVYCPSIPPPAPRRRLLDAEAAADATGPIQVPDTGGWTKLQTIRIDGVRVPAGRTVMKLVMDADGASGYVGDIDCMTFRRPQDPATSPHKP